MMSNPGAIPADIVDEAVGWMVASQDGLSRDEQLALDGWMRADERHRLAWERLERSFNPFRVLEASGVSGQRMVASLDQRSLSRRTFVVQGTMGIAATVTTLGVADRISPLRGWASDYRTATGERRRFALPDGSGLMLDARSEADLAFDTGRRGIVLLNGKALVEIAPNRIPFGFVSGDVAVSSRGGELMIARRDDACHIVCMTGSADIGVRGGARLALAASQGVMIAGESIRPMRTEDARDEASWRQGKLILHDRRLGDLVDAFRAYRAGVLSVSAEAARLRLSGVFDLDQGDEALDLLTEMLRVSVLTVGRLYTRIVIAGGEA